MVGRISSFTQTSRLIQNNLQLQANYAEKQLQISSGLKSTGYEGVATQSTRLLNLESDYSRLAQQTENVQLVTDRADIMFDAVGSIVGQTQKFIATLSSTISGFGSQGNDLINIAQIGLDQVAGSLNTQLADRYLFAGSATQTRPVDVNDPAWGGQIYVNPIPSTADTDYYQGDGFVQSVEARESFTVNYGVTADNAAFEKIMRGYDLIITNPTDLNTLIEAARIMEEGLDEASTLKASISQKAQVFDSQINSNLQEMNLIEEQIVNIQEVDLAEATVRLKQFESQLEASYSITTDLLKLNLADFLR